MSTDTDFGLAFATTPSAERRAAAEREEILADPGFGKHFTDHMATVQWTLDAGWHDASVHPYGPISLDPSASVPALRAGDLRGVEGLPARGRFGVDVPAGRQRPAVPAVRPSPRAPGAAGRDLRGLHPRTGPDRRRLGALGARDEPVPAAVHDRDRVVPGGPRGAGGGVPLHREPGGGVLHVRAEARVDLALDELRPSGQGRAPGRRRPAATTRRRSCPSRRHTSTAASRSCSSTRSRAGTSRSSAA